MWCVSVSDKGICFALLIRCVKQWLATGIQCFPVVMFDNSHNPLKPAILQVLKNSDQRLAIHQLLQAVKETTIIPELDDDVQLALFKMNWLMMNALFQLQADLLDEGYYLKISTLDIQLLPLSRQDRTAASRQLSQQPLRDYYMDWCHFSETTREQVQAILDGVWLQYISGHSLQNAYDVLGLDTSAGVSLIRKTYRKLAGRYHPDKGGDPSRFMAVREAYEILLKARGAE